MIVVDTSVWVDVLRGRDTPQARRCVELIEGGEPVALTDAVAPRSPVRGRGVVGGAHLRAFPILRLEGLDDFVLAAGLYRAARRQGVTIRKTLDSLNAAPCVRTGAPLCTWTLTSTASRRVHRCAFSSEAPGLVAESGPAVLQGRTIRT